METIEVTVEFKMDFGPERPTQENIVDAVERALGQHGGKVVAVRRKSGE